jgi:hypothetical protein
MCKRGSLEFFPPWLSISTMNKLSKTDIQRLQRDLYEYYATLGRNKDRLEKRSWLEKPLTFWMESVRFLISEMQIWNQTGNNSQYEKTLKRAQDAMDHVSRLMMELTKDS